MCSYGANRQRIVECDKKDITDQVYSNGSSSSLKILITTLLFVVVFKLGPGNWPLMRITCSGVPKGDWVPYVTFHSNSKTGSPAHATITTMESIHGNNAAEVIVVLFPMMKS